MASQNTRVKMKGLVVFLACPTFITSLLLQTHFIALNVTNHIEIKTIQVKSLTRCCAECEYDCGGVSYDNATFNCKLYRQFKMADNATDAPTELLVNEVIMPYIQPHLETDGLLVTAMGPSDATVTVTDLYDGSNICDSLEKGYSQSQYPTMGLVNNTYPVICGGYIGGNAGNIFKCQVFGFDGRIFSIPKALWIGISFQLDSERVWMFGGYTGSTSYIITIDGYQTGPLIPSNLQKAGMCAVQFDNESGMVIGGFNAGTSYKDTYMVSLVDFTFRPGPPTITPRYGGSACGIFINRSMGDRKVVVVTGGGQTSLSSLTARTEFYDIENEVWINGPDFYHVIAGGRIFPSWNGLSVFHVGGSVEPDTKDIHRLNCNADGCKWVIHRSGGLATPRRMFAGGMIPRKLATCSKP